MTADKNSLEIFLALNAEAFKRGLAAAGDGVNHMAGETSRSFAASKAHIESNTTAMGGYSSALAGHSGVVNILSSAVYGLAGAVGSVIGIVAGFQKMVEVTREFDKVNAGLITATGSADRAKVAFAAIQDFAAKTPYDLAQVSESFIKLVNFGLDPSERALSSYGNTASSLGKNLNEMIEAVADAATGEFERLKEFGIKSKVEGDTVAFTFRGITTEVGKNASEIEEYLINLGEINFGDAMANRMATLDGAMSNFGDAWNTLFLTVSKSGIGEAMAEGVRVGISAVESLTAAVASGELLAHLKASVGHWSSWGEDIAATINFVRKSFETDTDDIKSLWGLMVDFLITAFKQFPENVRALVQLATVGVASEFEKIKAEATFLMDSIKAVFTDGTMEEATANYIKEIKKIQAARNESVDAIYKERDAALESYKQQSAAAANLRSEYDKTRAASKAEKSDKLTQFAANDDSDIDAQVAKKEYQAKRAAEKKEREKATVSGQEKKLADWVKLEDERPLTQEEVEQKKKDKALLGELTRETKEVAKATDTAASAETEQGAAEERYQAARDARRLAQRRRRYMERTGKDSETFRNADGSITEITRVSGEDGTEKMEREYQELFAENAAREKKGRVTSTGAISAHGGALSKKEWQSLSKMQQAYLTQEASRPRSSWDYFSNKTGNRFKGEVDPTPALANAAKIMLKTNAIQSLQEKWLNTVTSRVGNSVISGRVGGQVSAATSADKQQAEQKKSSRADTVHELRFKGGSLRGNESDIEALLNQLAAAGMSAG